MTNAETGTSHQDSRLTVTRQGASWGGAVIEIKDGDAELRLAVKEGTSSELRALAADDRYRAARLLERAAFVERAAEALAATEPSNQVLPSVARS